MIGNQFFYLAIILLSQAILLASVDKSNFRNCDQTGFCRRHRNIKGEPSHWIIDPSSVKQSTDHPSVEAYLKNKENGVILKLEFMSLANEPSLLRMRINELHWGRERYEAREVMADNIEFASVQIKSQDDNQFVLQFGTTDQNYKAVVTLDPFRLDIFNNDKLILSGNARGFFKFEHFRQKQIVDENNNEVKENQPDDDGSWEETFKTFTDSKPYGPMSVGMDFSFVGFEHLYGIPEHADSLALRDTRGSSDPYRLYNTDVFEYELNSPMALYGSVPMIVAHSAEQTIGLLWLNPSETWVDIESSNQGVAGLFSNLVSGETKTRLTHWFSETGIVDVWFMPGPKPEDVMLQNAALVGTTQLPPYYSLGYHQSRWNYFSEEEVSKLDQSFDDHDIPLDAVWLDVEYTEDRSKKYFTWDSGFSNRQELISNLTAKGRRLITIIDPHIKKDTNYPVYNEAAQNGFFIKTREDRDYEGWCWPGTSMWPDLLNPATREWWASKFNPEFFPGFANGVVDIWNDMNEPSIFNGPDVSAPKDLVHFGGLEHRDIHNIYGYLCTKATHAGLFEHRPNLRPFILTRAFFAGSQKHCATWTGDNMAKWDHLAMSIPMILSLSITGISFSGADVPGFFFDPESDELVIRWYQAGAFQPFYRAHAHLHTRLREPYLYHEDIRHYLRKAIRARYSYLPYWYTLFYENTNNGMPPMRPLWFHFPKDENTFAIQNAHLLGDALLVHPVIEKEVKSIQVYLPGKGESWLELHTGQIFEGGNYKETPVELSTIPLYQRSGTIIPKRERMRRSAALTLNDPITLQIFLNSEESYAFGKIYLDDGYTYDYKSGGYIFGEIIYNKKKLNYKITHGGFPTKTWLERVRIYGISNKPSKIESSNGRNLAFKYNSELKMLIIRKPALTMGDQWEITIY